MSNSKNDKNTNKSNQHSSTSHNRGANSKKSTHDSSQSSSTSSKNKGANNKQPNNSNQQGANDKKPQDNGATNKSANVKNDSDTISTGTAGSLMCSDTDDSSSSLWTYEDLVIKDDASVYLDMTRDLAESITTSIANAIAGSVSPQSLTNLKGSILANLALWASTHIKGSTNMEPLEDKDNIIDLVHNIKLSVVRKAVDSSKSQVRFSEIGIKTLDSDDSKIAVSPEIIKVEEPETSETSDTPTAQERSLVWDKLNIVLNVFKGLFFVGCKSNNRDKSNNKDEFKNPIAGTSKDPVPLADLGKPRPSILSGQMITLLPRSQSRNIEITSSESDKDGQRFPRPKRPRPPNKEKTKSKSSLKFKESNTKVEPKDVNRKSSATLDSKANLAIASSIIAAGLKQRFKSSIGLTQLIQNFLFKDPSNVKELINLLCGMKATKDWARDGKYLFHFPEDLRTFGTLLAQIAGGCILNGSIITTQDSKLSSRSARFSAITTKTVKNDTENELFSGFLRALGIMSNSKDDKNTNKSNQHSSTSHNRGANSKKSTHDSSQSSSTSSKNKGANNKQPNNSNQQGANDKKPQNNGATNKSANVKNDSDTISTGTAGSLMYSDTDDSSSSLWTYEDLVIKDDASVYLDMTRDLAESITTSIANAIAGSVSPQSLTNLKGSILANLALWASTHIKGSTNMEPLEDKDNIIDLVHNIKLSVVRKAVDSSKSQVRFSEIGIKTLDSDDSKIAVSPEIIKIEKPETSEMSDTPTAQERSLWDKLNIVLNVFKGLFFVGCKSDNRDKSNNKDEFKNPVAGTSKDPVPLADLGKPRPSILSGQMITLLPRLQSRNIEITSSESDKDGQRFPRPKRPRPPNKEKTKSKSSLKFKESNTKVEPKDVNHKSSATLNSKANLAIASSIIAAGLKQRFKSSIGLTQLIQNFLFKDPSNVKELINLLCGMKATKDWARDGKYLFHFPEDLRTFGTLLAQIAGGCILNGSIITTQDSKLSSRSARFSAITTKTVKNDTENELFSGFLRALVGLYKHPQLFEGYLVESTLVFYKRKITICHEISNTSGKNSFPIILLEMKDGVDNFARGFQDGIHSFSPGIRRY